jgi:hypothetical protein
MGVGISGAGAAHDRVAGQTVLILRMFAYLLWSPALFAVIAAVISPVAGLAGLALFAVSAVLLIQAGRPPG